MFLHSLQEQVVCAALSRFVMPLLCCDLTPGPGVVDQTSRRVRSAPSCDCDVLIPRCSVGISPALTGRLQGETRHSLNRANAARRAAHRVRMAPPWCQQRATGDAQSEAVGHTHARGDAHGGHDGAPSSIGVRTGTADSPFPPAYPSRICQEGVHISLELLPLERPPRCALPPTRSRSPSLHGRISAVKIG